MHNTIKKLILTLMVLLLTACHPDKNQASAIPYQDYEKQVQPIVQAMTLDEKLGQMTLPKFAMIQTNDKINFNLIDQYHLGALLAAGGEVPNGRGGVLSAMDEAKDYRYATLQNWQALLNQTKQHPVIITVNHQRVEIPLLLGVDAVHGAYNILGATLFPQNISLSMTHDPKLLEESAYWTAHDVLASGFNWIYAPTVAITHNPNWGRTFESLGSTPAWTRIYAAALIKGFQQNDVKHGTINGVLATAKHYIGDGATWNGIDEGNVHVFDMKRFLTVNFAGYAGAIDESIGSIMVSYSAINTLPMSFNRYQLTALLKNGGKEVSSKPFEGLLVSDYGADDKAASQGLPATPVKMPYQQALVTSINSGMDLVMLSNAAGYKTVAKFLAILKENVQSGVIPMTRINDAVTHILAVKYAMGLIHLNNQGQWVANQRYSLQPANTTQSEQQTAIQTAEESFVLLKNQAALLPLKRQEIKYLVLVGESRIPTRQDSGQYITTLYQNYDNIGAQNGGWTVAWQGINGNGLWQDQDKQRADATSLLDGIKKIAPTITLIYPNYPSKTDHVTEARRDYFKNLNLLLPKLNSHNTIIVGTLAEVPYSEFMGDIAAPYCTDDKTFDHGCLYNMHFNPYLPKQQKRTLAIQYSSFDQKIIKVLQEKNIPLVTILISGRPMIISQPKGPLQTSQAMLAAWLSGTSGGEALANVLFGNYHFRQKNNANTLSLNWVRNMEQLKNYPIYETGEGFVGYQNPLFPIGYGLSD